MTADKIKTFDVLIEIPRGSRNKYEYDFEIKIMLVQNFILIIVFFGFFVHH